MSTHTDVSDSYLCLLGSSYFYSALLIEIDYMDGLGGCLGHRLNHHIVLRILMDVIVQHWKHFTMSIREFFFEWCLTDLAFKAFPDVWVHHWGLLAVSLALQPLLQALQSNELHWASAYARTNQVMLRHLVLLTQANPTNGLPWSILLIYPRVFLLRTIVRQLLALIKWPLVEFKRVIGLGVLPHYGVQTGISIDSRWVHCRYPLTFYLTLSHGKCCIAPSQRILGTNPLGMDGPQGSSLLWCVLSLLYGECFDAESNSTKLKEITFLHLDVFQDVLLSMGPVLNHGTRGNLPSLKIG